MRANTLQNVRARGGDRAAIHVYETRLGCPRRVEAVFEKQIVLHDFKRGAAVPVSTGDAVEPKAGMVAGATTRQPLRACAFLGLHSGRWQARNSAASAHAARFDSHSVVSNQRKLRS